MTDTPREILEDTLTEEESTEVETPTEEVQDDGGQTESQEEIEAFADKPELQGKTPEELDEIYQNWQSSYTKKRQAETAQIKQMQQELEELRKLKEQSGTQQPQQQLRTQQYQEAADQAKQQRDLGQMSVDDYTNYMRQLMAQEAREIARSEFETLSAQQKEDANMAQMVTDFKSTDNRLDQNSPTYDETLFNIVRNEVGERLESYYQQNQTSIGFDVKKEAAEIIKREEERLDQIIKQRTQQSTLQARKRANEVKKGSLSGTSGSSQSKTGNSIRDIISDSLDEVA